MKIRQKLLDFKARLSDRKMYSIVIVVICAVALWGFYQYKEASEYRQRLDNQYNRAFFDMVGYVQNVETLLIKSLLTSTPSKTSATMQEAWRQANFAQANLGQIPISQQVLSNTSKFLNQVGDFAYSLNNQNMNGQPITSEQYEKIQKLHGFAVSLGDSLTTLETDITTGRIRWNELARKGIPIFRRTSENLPNQAFKDIDKTFQDYPTLIYDGPFSDHMIEAKPKGLTGQNLSSKQLQEKVIEFIGKEKVAKAVEVSKNENADLATYSFEVEYKNRPEEEKAYVDITKKGGHILWMIYNRPVQKETLSVEQAKQKGLEFLKSRGYEGMVDTYYLKENGTATINYAFKQDDVVIYTDLIKVKVALDDGEIVGFESKAYIYAHRERDIPEPKITLEEARELINPEMEVLSTGLAIIPTNHKTEIFTYEFKGKLLDRDFLVYINAETGKEENVLMIIDTPEGILTM